MNTISAILPSHQETSHDFKERQANHITLLCRHFVGRQLKVSREANGRLRGWVTDGKTTEVKLKGLSTYLTLQQVTQLFNQSYLKFHKEAIEILPRGLGGMKRMELSEIADKQEEKSFLFQREEPAELYGKTLDLTRQDYKTVRQALNELKSSSTIEHLNLSGCNKLKDKDLNNVTKMPYLKEIDLSRCSEVSVSMIFYKLFLNSTSIDRLILKENPQITRQNVKEICMCFIHSRKDLQHAHINLEGCKQLIDEDIINLEGFDLISWVLPSGKYKAALSAFQNTTFAHLGSSSGRMSSISNSGKQVISEELLSNIDSLIGQIRNHEEKEAVREAVDELLKNDPEKKDWDLIHKHIGNTGIQAIAAALKVNHTLQSLNIRNRIGNYIGAAHISDAGAQALGDALRVNHALKSLNLIASSIYPTSALAIGAAFQVNHTLESLDLSHNNIGCQGARVFAHVLQVNHTLQSLNLMWNGIKKAGIQALGTALAVNQSLQSLNLGGNYFMGVNTYPIRAALEVNHTLQSLHLQYARITNENVQDLEAILQVNQTLQSLDLGYNQISDVGARALAVALQDNHTLQILNLSKNNVGAEGAQLLGAALQVNHTLQSLNLNHNQIGTAGAQALGIALQVNQSLQSLGFEDNHIGDAGARALAAALQVNQTLQSLDLGYNQTGDAGARALAAALQVNQTLQSLNLNHNQIGAVGAQLLGAVLQVNHTLQSLDLGYNQTGNAGARALAVALQVNHTLQSLNLSKNNIGVEGAQLLGAALQVNQILQSLNLCGNQIGSIGAQALGAALEVNHSIQMLNLWHNQIGNEGAWAIGSALYINQTLQSLNLDNNQIGDEGVQALKTALKVNDTLQVLNFVHNHIGAEGIITEKRIQTLLEANKQIAIRFQQQITQVQSFLQSHENDDDILLEHLPQLKELLSKWHTTSNGFIPSLQAILRQSGKTNLNDRYKEKLEGIIKDLTNRLYDLWLGSFEKKVAALSNEYVMGKESSEKRNVDLGHALYETWLTFLGFDCPNWIEDHVQSLLPFSVLLDIAEDGNKQDVSELKDPHSLFQRVLSFKNESKDSLLSLTNQSKKS